MIIFMKQQLFVICHIALISFLYASPDYQDIDSNSSYEEAVNWVYPGGEDFFDILNDVKYSNDNISDDVRLLISRMENEASLEAARDIMIILPERSVANLHAKRFLGENGTAAESYEFYRAILFSREYLLPLVTGVARESLDETTDKGSWHIRIEQYTSEHDEDRFLDRASRLGSADAKSVKLFQDFWRTPSQDSFSQMKILDEVEGVIETLDKNNPLRAKIELKRDICQAVSGSPSPKSAYELLSDWAFFNSTRLKFELETSAQVGDYMGKFLLGAMFSSLWEQLLKLAEDETDDADEYFTAKIEKLVKDYGSLFPEFYYLVETCEWRDDLFAFATNAAKGGMALSEAMDSYMFVAGGSSINLCLSLLNNRFDAMGSQNDLYGAHELFLGFPPAFEEASLDIAGKYMEVSERALGELLSPVRWINYLNNYITHVEVTRDNIKKLIGSIPSLLHFASSLADKSLWHLAILSIYDNPKVKELYPEKDDDYHAKMFIDNVVDSMDKEGRFFIVEDYIQYFRGLAKSEAITFSFHDISSGLSKVVKYLEKTDTKHFRNPREKSYFISAFSEILIAHTPSSLLLEELSQRFITRYDKLNSGIRGLVQAIDLSKDVNNVLPDILAAMLKFIVGQDWDGGDVAVYLDILPVPIRKEFLLKRVISNPTSIEDALLLVTQLDAGDPILQVARPHLYNVYAKYKDGPEFKDMLKRVRDEVGVEEEAAFLEAIAELIELTEHYDSPEHGDFAEIENYYSIGELMTNRGSLFSAGIDGTCDAERIIGSTFLISQVQSFIQRRLSFGDNTEQLNFGESARLYSAEFLALRLRSNSHRVNYYIDELIRSKILDLSALIPLPESSALCTALSLAAVSGDSYLCSFLLEQGADVNYTPDEVFSPLTSAAAGGHKSTVATLIDSGASPDRMAVFMTLVGDGHRNGPEIASLLINAGANVRGENSGQTLLHDIAIAGRDPNAIDFLIKSGLDLEARDSVGMTPLMFAAKESPSPEILSALINAGANHKARSESGETALDYAKANENIYRTKAYWELNDLFQRQQ